MEYMDVPWVHPLILLFSADDHSIIDGEYLFQRTIPVSSACCGRDTCCNLEQTEVYPFHMDQLNWVTSHVN